MPNLTKIPVWIYGILSIPVVAIFVVGMNAPRETTDQKIDRVCASSLLETPADCRLHYTVKQMAVEVVAIQADQDRKIGE